MTDEEFQRELQRDFDGIAPMSGAAHAQLRAEGRRISREWLARQHECGPNCSLDLRDDAMSWSPVDGEELL